MSSQCNNGYESRFFILIRPELFKLEEKRLKREDGSDWAWLAKKFVITTKEPTEIMKWEIRNELLEFYRDLKY